MRDHQRCCGGAGKDSSLRPTDYEQAPEKVAGCHWPVNRPVDDASWVRRADSFWRVTERILPGSCSPLPNSCPSRSLLSAPSPSASLRTTTQIPAHLFAYGGNGRSLPDDSDPISESKTQEGTSMSDHVSTTGILIAAAGLAAAVVLALTLGGQPAGAAFPGQNGKIVFDLSLIHI